MSLVIVGEHGDLCAICEALESSGEHRIGLWTVDLSLSHVGMQMHVSAWPGEVLIFCGTYAGYRTYLCKCTGGYMLEPVSDMWLAELLD